MTGNNMTQKALIPNPEDRIMCVKVGMVKTEQTVTAKTAMLLQI